MLLENDGKFGLYLQWRGNDWELLPIGERRFLSWRCPRWRRRTSPRHRRWWMRGRMFVDGALIPSDRSSRSPSTKQTNPVICHYNTPNKVSRFICPPFISFVAGLLNAIPLDLWQMEIFFPLLTHSLSTTRYLAVDCDFSRKNLYSVINLYYIIISYQMGLYLVRLRWRSVKIAERSIDKSPERANHWKISDLRPRHCLFCENKEARSINETKL